MTSHLHLSAVPFAVVASHPEVWRLLDADSAAVVADAPARTDLYVDPTGGVAAGAEATLDAPTLLGTPPAGDFQLRARVTVDFEAQYDAGVLLIWIDERHWAKFCFEFSPDAEPMVVSIVTRNVSDDANAFVVPDHTIWLRVSRVGPVYGFHASTDGDHWRLVRVFTFGDSTLGDHQAGFEAQSPTGDGCRVTFDHIGFSSDTLGNLRDGS